MSFVSPRPERIISLISFKKVKSLMLSDTNFSIELRGLISSAVNCLPISCCSSGMRVRIKALRSAALSNM